MILAYKLFLACRRQWLAVPQQQANNGSWSPSDKHRVTQVSDCPVNCPGPYCTVLYCTGIVKVEVRHGKCESVQVCKCPRSPSRIHNAKGGIQKNALLYCESIVISLESSEREVDSIHCCIYLFFALYRHLLVWLFDRQYPRIDRQSLYEHTLAFIQTQTLHVAIYAFAFGALNMFACQFCSAQSLFLSCSDLFHFFCLPVSLRRLCSYSVASRRYIVRRAYRSKRVSFDRLFVPIYSALQSFAFAQCWTDFLVLSAVPFFGLRQRVWKCSIVSALALTLSLSEFPFFSSAVCCLFHLMLSR